MIWGFGVSFLRLDILLFCCSIAGRLFPILGEFGDHILACDVSNSYDTSPDSKPRPIAPEPPSRRGYHMGRTSEQLIQAVNHIAITDVEEVYGVLLEARAKEGIGD